MARRLRELTADTGLDEQVPLDHVAARLASILERAHELAAGTLDGGLIHLMAPRRFNRLFKVP